MKKESTKILPEPSETTYFGYIPPRNYAFSSMSEALLHYIAALCSVECSRFLMYIDTHPSRKNPLLSQFLSRYTLAEWALGNIDELAWKGRDLHAKESLKAWALAMVEFNTIFREKGLDDPVKFVEGKKLIEKRQGRYGWEPNLEEIERILKIDIRSIDISRYTTSTQEVNSQK